MTKREFRDEVAKISARRRKANLAVFARIRLDESRRGLRQAPTAAQRERDERLIEEAK